MAASTTMTIRVSPEVKAKLDKIAADTRRSRSFLAAEALAAYVERELEFVEGVRLALADVKAGRLVSHADAMVEIDAAIAAADPNDRA